MSDLTRVLIVASDRALQDAIHRRVSPVLMGYDCEVFRAPEGTALLELVQARKFDLIIVGHPMERPPLNDLLRSVRWAESACHGTPLVVFGEVAELATVELHRGRGVNRIVPLDAPDAVVQRTIADLLAVAPRLALKTMLRLEMFLDSATEKRVAQTDNLSATGMLVQGRSRYDEGTAFRFEFTPPGELRPIKGTGEVVRRTTPAREGVEGFAARFAEFEADGQDRLRRFLEAQISSR
jgi:hypothetical protein